MSRPVRLLHVINCLSLGGAQRMLLKLLATMDRSRYDPTVLTLLARDALAPQVRELEIPLISAGVTRGRPWGAMTFWKLARSLEVDLVQGWMYYGNLAALAIRGPAGHSPRVAWNIRHSVYDIGAEKVVTAAAIRLGARASGRPRRIVYNSTVTADQHEGMGYASVGRSVIPNGFDLDRFAPSPASRSALANVIGNGEPGPVVGLVARFHPMKDHRSFVNAAARLAAARADVRFLMAGDDVTWENPTLRGWIEETGLEGRFHLLGPRDDVHTFLPALSVATLCSAWGEGFPNVVGEAMAAAVPVVATDVGETRTVVGEDEWIVPPGDPEALAAGWKRALELTPSAREALGRRLRERVADRYSLPAVARAYESMYDQLVGEG